MDKVSTAASCGYNKSALYHLQPTDIEEKLQQGEDRQVEVHIVTRVPLSWIQELTTNQTSQEKAVDRHGRHLRHESSVSQLPLKIGSCEEFV